MNLSSLWIRAKSGIIIDMKKERTLLFIGIWVALLPHLGFPENWRKILFLITGLFIVFIAYVMYKRKRKHQIALEKTPNDVMSTFSESIPEEKFSPREDFEMNNDINVE